MDRPDLSQVAPAVREYIDYLETELLELRLQVEVSTFSERPEPSEEPTTWNVISVSETGVAKRTARHFYSRQRRGGMGVFDLESPEGDYPAHLVIADAAHDLLLFTNLGRVFRRPVSAITETEVRGRGKSLLAQLPFPLAAGEHLAAVLPNSGEGERWPFAILFSQRGWVRRVRHNYLGPRLIPGTTFHDPKNGGSLVAACWSPGNADLFIVTRRGLAIRFDEQQVPPSGCRGLRVEPDDEVIAGTAVSDEGGVFLLSADGKGTIRLMSGFRANRAPGAGGKVALKTDRLVAATAVDEHEDLFILSRLGKIIRFSAADVPPKEGSVQGVHCMNLRADETVAAIASAPGLKPVSGD
jgi:DNA gyrase subunit A